MSFLPARAAYAALLAGWLIVVATYALLELARGAEPLLSWFGLAMAALGPLSFLARQRFAGDGRRKPHHLAYTTIGGLGLGICLALSWRFGNAAGAIHVWAGISLLGWVGYVRLINTPSASPRD